jgi:lipid II:glycine glycyltransferase (peptidoglycan interpeptide bridge formation enzyme)
MDVIEIKKSNKEEYNTVITHPLQSYEWGEFRKKTGVKVIRRGIIKNGKIVDGFTLTIHKIPKTKFNIGYLPKGNIPTKETLEELKRIGKEEKCIFIQLEPNVIHNSKFSIHNSLRPSFHPLFTKFTFILDISKSEEELLKNFHPKTRYNIKVAQKHNIKVEEQTSDKAFEEYLRLTEETTTRQRFFAHTPSYHKNMWETLKIQNKKLQDLDNLSAHLLTATYKPENEKEQTLVSWILFVFHDYIYYPYGASSTKFRNTMASNLIMWEAIKYGKKLGLKYFDMWGAMGINPDKKDPWYGFHKFKEGYGATLTEFVGSYDLVINPTIYQFYKLADKARWIFLKLKRFL